MRRLGTLILTAVLATGALSAGGASTASAKQGTFTAITTPSGTELLRFDSRPDSTKNHFTVSGTTSNDVTSVDIDCLLQEPDGSPETLQWASGVAVVDGAFSAIANVVSITAQCRLLAIPSGVDVDSDYLGSYRGPLVYSYSAGSFLDSNHVPYASLLVDMAGDGVGAYEQSDGCDGIALLATVALPRMDVVGPAVPECLADLAEGNVGVNEKSTASSIRVDGHSAYTPQMVHDFVIGDSGVTVKQSRLTVTVGRRAANGDLSMTQSGPLMRCSHDDSYPPTHASCPKLVSTGVTFREVISMVHDVHEVSLRQSYVSTDGKAHRISVVVANDATPPDNGATGFTFPGHGSAFKGSTSAEVVTGLGHKAGTMLVRSDLDSFEGSGEADTQGITYSRAPSSIEFVKTPKDVRPDAWQLPFALRVPAHGAEYLGLVVTENNLTASTKALAASAVAAMVSAPVVTSPHNKATVHAHRVTVKGSVALGANGLPVSVTVNGHKAHLARTASKVTFSAAVSVPLGRHTVTVTATDAAGNARTTKVSVDRKT